MKWEKYNIDEIKATNKYSLVGGPFGSDLVSKDYTEDGVPVLRGVNLPVDKRFSHDNLVFVSEEKAEKLRSNLAFPDDIVFTQRGTLGQVGLIPKGFYDKYVVSQSQMKLTVDSQIAVPAFVYYYFSSVEGRTGLQAHSITSGVPHINLGILKNLNVPLPKISVQQKIVSILSAYDDLIENNLKRIKLLEEKARLFFKTFVEEFTYRGNTYQLLIKDCLSFYVGGGWGDEEYKEGYTEPAYVIRGTDILAVKGGDLANLPLRFHKPSNLASRTLAAGDIVFEISNGQINNIGRSLLVSEKILSQLSKPVICASFAKLIRVNDKVSPEFFHLYLNDSQENGLLYKYKSNSANGINNFAFEIFINEVSIHLPPEKELIKFTDQVRPIFSLISSLGEQNTKLREARDILLPRLMSGEIDV